MDMLKNKTIRVFNEIVEQSSSDLCTHEERCQYSDAPYNIRNSIVSW